LEMIQFLTPTTNRTITIYIKEKQDGKKKIMCCPNLYFAQVYKLLMGKLLYQNDLVFCYEKEIANFSPPLKLKI
jgi:hypothetical protein